MSKPLAVGILALVAVIVAGAYGALHNQLSYSVGSSYFHDLKFAQFGIDPHLQNRLGASLVGWQASWWMGLIVGLPAFLLGAVILRRPQRLLAAGLGAIGAVIITVLLFSMGGLILGMMAPQYAASLPLPEGITDTESFLRAALMHEASYYGGFVGALVALISVWQSRKAEQLYEEDRKNAS
jgi:hypothetical protein